MDDGRRPLDHALFDGEDFELLFTVDPARGKDLQVAWGKRFELSLTAIGRIARGPVAVYLLDDAGQTVEIRDGGFEHFRT